MMQENLGTKITPDYSNTLVGNVHYCRTVWHTDHWQVG